PEVFEKVFQASREGFDSIKGAPLIGKDWFEGAHEFRWRSTVVLPGGTSCVLVLLSSNSHLPSSPSEVPSYQCDMSIVDRGQLFAGIRAALGPGWSSEPIAWASSGEVLMAGFFEAGQDVDHRRVTAGGNTPKKGYVHI